MIKDILFIGGSLGLFLYGMRVMSDGLQKAAGERLHNILNLMTINRFAAMMTGFVITAIIQSSSAVTVMVVGFVNAGLLSLIQAIGVILGSNVGTTVTGWMVAFLGFKVEISLVALPSIGIGIVLLFVKRLQLEDWGEALIGFGVLFLGLKFLKDSMPDIRSNLEILQFLSRYMGMGLPSFLIFVAAGTLVTMVVQSSSAAMAVTLTMAHAGWIDFPTAAAVVLGENIGTTITAYLASLGTTADARRAARVHMIVKTLGVVWIAFIFRPFLSLVDWIIPGSVTGNDGVTIHLAMFHTLFNVANTLLFIGLVPYLARLAQKIVRPKPAEEQRVYRLKYISTAIQDTPEINILNARRELCRMADVISEMFVIFLQVFSNPQKKMKAEVRRMKDMEELTDQMQEEISRYLVACSQENLNESSATNVNAMIRIVGELESIADSCFNLILLSQRRYDKKITLARKATEGIQSYSQLVMDFIEFNKRHLNERLSEEELDSAFELERRIDKYRDALKKTAQARLKKDSRIKSELLFMDFVGHLEHIGDYSLNISQALRRMK